MKKLLPVASILVLVPFVSGSFQEREPAQGQSIESRVAKLEEDLAAERKRSAEMRDLLGETIAYLEAQANAAQTLLGVLDDSEREGFTAGINFRSREILLAGLRAYWTGQQKGLPRLASPAPAPAKPAPPAPRQKQD